MKLAGSISMLAVLALTVSASQAPPPRSLPPTQDELKSATYTGISEVPGTIKLQNGKWTGTASARGAASRPVVELAGNFRVVGDLDGGSDEVVIVLTYSSSGSGSISYLAVMSRRNGVILNVATAALGDRVQLRSAKIEGRKLLVTAVRAGSKDAACCPGELVQWQWTLSGGKLTTPGAVSTGRLSLTAIAGTEWVLRAWDIAEPAEPEPVVTLAYDAGRISGTSGCNRYTAGVKEGSAPGELSVGLLAGTRMACPPAQSSVETRFVGQVSAAKTFGFMLGSLTISYAKSNGTRGTMLFDRRTPSK